jgi:ANTAR domain
VPDPSPSSSRGPLPPPPPLPEAGTALLAHLLDALVEAVPGAVGAALALLMGEGSSTQSQVVAAVGAIGGAAGGAARLPDGPTVVTVRGEGEGEERVAVALVLDRLPGPSDADSAGAALPGLALAVGVLRAWAAETERAEQMVQMVQYRRVIEQAKGLVMAVTGSDAAAAFATLARASQHFNVRLRNLAVALVELVGGGPAEGPDDPAAVLVPGERDRSAAVRMWAALGGGVAGGRGEG